MEKKGYRPGSFCWADLVTVDTDGAKLFGWSYKDAPVGPGMVYTMLRKNGNAVCVLYDMRGEMRGHGISPHWQAYVIVDDVNEVSRKSKNLNGNVMVPPMDVMDAVRMTVV